MTDKFTICNMGLNGSFIKENGKIMEIERVVDLLNALYDENEQLKLLLREVEHELTTLTGLTATDSTSIVKEDMEEYGFFLNKLNGLHRDVVRGRERNSHVESIVKSSIHDEKTAFGRMVLKQLADKLGVDYD